MTDSYILVRCDYSQVGPVRKAVHEALGKSGASMVYTDGHTAALSGLDQHIYDRNVRVLEQMIRGNIEALRTARDTQKKCVRATVCDDCGRIIASRCQRPRMTTFLKRKGWKTRLYMDKAPALVCGTCANPDTDLPISIFSDQYRSASNLPQWVRVDD